MPDAKSRGRRCRKWYWPAIEARRAYAAEPERASPFTIADRATLVPRIVRVYLDVNQIAELPVAERVRATVDGLADAAGRLNDLQREITQGPQQEYEAASARFAAAHEAAIYGDGILAAVLAEGEMVVALGTAIAADMAAIATAMAELEAMTPAEVPAEALASVTQSRRSYEQSAEGVKLVVETQRALVEQLRGLVAAEAR